MNDPKPRKHSRIGLYAPYILLLLVLAGWTVWWFYLADQVRQRLDQQAQGLRGAGWQVAYVDGGVSGWPFRTKVAFDHVSVTAPSGHAVAAPRLVAEANAYDPQTWVVVAPDGVTLTRAAKGKLAIRATAIRMSVHGLTQRWPNVALELAQAQFTPLPGAEPFPIMRAERVQMYLRPHRAQPGQAAADTSVDLLFRLIDADARPGGPVEGMTQGGKLTVQLETVIERADRLNGGDPAGLFATWTRSGGRFSRIRGELAAGESKATLSSDVLSASADGRLNGQLAMTAVSPMSAIAGLAQSNTDRPGTGVGDRMGAVAAAGAAAATGQDDKPVELTVVFRNGRAFLGPFALAPAPKLF